MFLLHMPHRQGDSRRSLSHTHIDLNMQIQCLLMHAQATKYTAASFLCACLCVNRHMQDAESLHACDFSTHALLRAVLAARADTVHISRSFSFAIRASAHESPLSLSSFLPHSPFILSLSLALRAFEMVMSRDSADVFIPLVLGLGAPQLSAH